MSTGWIRLHRQIQDNPLWTCEAFTRGQAWVDLLLLANHSESFFYKRDIKISVKRGQVGRSEVELADRWKWSRSKVRKFLKDLEKEQQLTQQKSNVTQLLTINNYEEYQKKEQQDIQQEDSKKTAKEQQENTYNNDKNIKNDKNDNKRTATNTRFQPPILEDIASYCLQRNNGVDSVKFHNFYSAKGWMVGKNKMKDWRAAVRTWEKPKQQNDSTGGW